MQTLFIVLIFGGFIVYLHFGSHLVPNRRVGAIHEFLPYLLVNWTFCTFLLASTTSPGYITQKNQAALEQIYPYDGFVFVQRKCDTCGVNRVARSKHCKIVGRCIEKYDHFWFVNQLNLF